MPDTACAVGGCPRPAWARGWCGTHYARWRKTGSTDDPPPRTRRHETYAEYDRERRERDLEGYRAERTANNAAYRDRNRAAIRERQEARRLRLESDPEVGATHRRAHIARAIVSNAVKSGKLIRPENCEQCGGPGPIEGAHEDYSRPLEVRWLCQKCHRRWDAADPKTRK